MEARTALVTGASRGIGRAIAIRLARGGALVAVHHARDGDAAAATVDAIRADGGRAFTVKMEFGRDDTDVDALLEEVDGRLRSDTGSARLDVLVNNAGVSPRATIEHTTRADFDRVFAVNVRDAFFLTRGALSRMGDGGRIVNVSSGVTRIAFPATVAYAMTKGAIQTLTLTLAQELGERGITVNGVAPGIVDTDLNAGWLRGNQDAERFAAQASALRRVGRPDDIADVVAFLASADARFVTGQIIDATGGAVLG